jgi:hypothetical protein
VDILYPWTGARRTGEANLAASECKEMGPEDF